MTHRTGQIQMMGMMITSGKEDIGYQGQAAQQDTVLSLIHLSAVRVSYIQLQHS